MKKILAILLLTVATPALAQNPSAQPVAQTQNTIQQDIAKAESYFKTLSTAKARFVQTAPDGTQSRGNFYLNRPGKLRFEYDAPIKDFVVADGLFIYFYDAQLKQQTNAPISMTLADFLLRKNLKLSGDLKVTNVKRDGGLMQMTIVQTASPGAGSLTLGFTDGPNFALKKWQIRDAMGSITEIELFNIETGMKLSSDLFRYFDPVKKGFN